MCTGHVSEVMPSVEALFVGAVPGGYSVGRVALPSDNASIGTPAVASAAVLTQTPGRGDGFTGAILYFTLTGTSWKVCSAT